MAFTVPPPNKKQRSDSPLTKRIKDMRPNTDLLFSGEEPGSVKSIASRLARELGRRYETAKEGRGVRVWRHS